MMVQGEESNRAGRGSLLPLCDNAKENKLLKTLSDIVTLCRSLPYTS